MTTYDVLCEVRGVLGRTIIFAHMSRPLDPNFLQCASGLLSISETQLGRPSESPGMTMYRSFP